MNLIYRFLPLFGGIVALLTELLLSNHRRHPATAYPYYEYLLIILSGIFAVFAILSFFSKAASAHLARKGKLYLAAFIFLSVLNILTAKTAVFPPLLFPSFDNVLSIFVEKTSLVVKCILHSFKLLGLGVFFGITIGLIVGSAVGFSLRANYWLNPVIKIIGPIPATAWIPFALVVFPTTFGASVFVVALAVWFPVVLLTSSGIQNVPNSYFEVGKTLGAGKAHELLRIAVPAALPGIFQGIFFGVCSAFIALMTGEMFGAKAGIGWFINMEKELAEFKGVYAGLILIALFCTVILGLLFKVRSKVLRWQKGLIKW
ncbi:MAG: ABC transporter permease subunit [Treponema sp.]|nr:ABC transporter permease subunit [Treponema sp.]